MAPAIRALEDGDLDELGRFLIEGFGAESDAEFAAIDVLRWKYLERIGQGRGPRSFVAGFEGRIVGHVGLVKSGFVDTSRPAWCVPALHMIDWLGSKEQRSVGVSLMRRAHAEAEAQYVLGGSDAARIVTRRAGYASRRPVPVFRKTLRLRSRLRESGSPVKRGGRLLRDVVRAVTSSVRGENCQVALRPVEEFGAEVNEVVGRWPERMVLSSRSPELLNHLMKYPRGGPSGWLLEERGAVRGFALLNVLNRDRIRVGRIVELFLDTPDAGLWTSATAALVQELKGRGADVAEAMGSTPWAAEALLRLGFRRGFDLEYLLRDLKGQIPVDAPFHITFCEADYAYK